MQSRMWAFANGTFFTNVHHALWHQEFKGGLKVSHQCLRIRKFKKKIFEHSNASVQMSREFQDQNKSNIWWRMHLEVCCFLLAGLCFTQPDSVCNLRVETCTRNEQSWSIMDWIIMSLFWISVFVDLMKPGSLATLLMQHWCGWIFGPPLLSSHGLLCQRPLRCIWDIWGCCTGEYKFTWAVRAELSAATCTQTQLITIVYRNT